MGRLVREDLSEEVTLGWDLSDEKMPNIRGGVKGLQGGNEFEEFEEYQS